MRRQIPSVRERRPSQSMASSTQGLGVPLPATDPQKLFSDARDSFLESLSEEERSLYSKCTSADDILQELRTFAAFKQNHRRWSKPFNQLKTFAERLEPYFEIVSICIQSNPQWTAIAWGAIRLTLQVLPR